MSAMVERVDDLVVPQWVIDGAARLGAAREAEFDRLGWLALLDAAVVRMVRAGKTTSQIAGDADFLALVNGAFDDGRAR